MGDPEYENEYMSRKQKLRSLHKRLRETKEVQEIYHKIMGSAEDSDKKDADTSFEEEFDN